MKVEKAKISDVKIIHALISSHAELDRMLFRSIADIYENLQSFHLARRDDVIVGCCALKIIWADIAEIKSLAVDSKYLGEGIGKALVEAVITEAGQLGIKRLFTLTLEPQFFRKLGFVTVAKETLPMKVWSDCARCPKQDHCDETALVMQLG